MKRRVIGMIFIACLFMLTACQSDEAKSVENLIGDFNVITEESRSRIQTVRQAYNNLSEKDKKTIDNYQQLLGAEVSYDKIFSNKVDQLIIEIGTIDEGSKASIESAQSAYEMLTKSQRALVANFRLLLDAEKKYNDYIINRSMSTLSALADTSLLDEEAITLAEKIYKTLNADQKLQVQKQVGDPAALILKARVQIVKNSIDRIFYEGAVPSKSDLNAMIKAIRLYQTLHENAKAQVENYEDLKKAMKGFSRYMDTRYKDDGLYIRKQFIDKSKPLTYEELMLDPIFYKGELISMQVQISDIEEGRFLFPDKIVALDQTSNQAVQLKDNRFIKEPVLSKGNTFILYGTFEGAGTLKITGGPSDQMSKINGKYRVPVINFLYTSMDNLGIISTGDPDATVVDLDQETEALKIVLSRLIQEIQ